MRYSLGSAVVLKDMAIYAVIREFDDHLVGALRLNSLSLVVSEEQAKLLHLQKIPGRICKVSCIRKNDAHAVSGHTDSEPRDHQVNENHVQAEQFTGN